MPRTKTVDPVEEAIGRLEELRNEEERIRDRLRALDGERMAIREGIERAEQELQEAIAGGILEPPEGLSTRLAELKARLGDIDREEEELKTQAERAKQEQIRILRDAIRPAWKSYVEARRAELHAAPRVVERVRKDLQPFLNARTERIRAEGEVDRLLAMAGRLAGPRAKGAVAGRLAQELPPPPVPEHFGGRRAWRTAMELLRLFSSAVWTSPEYGN